MAKRFNKLGIRSIELRPFHDEMVTHAAWEQKGEDGQIHIEARLTLYDGNGKSWTGVIDDMILEDQDQKAGAKVTR